MSALEASKRVTTEIVPPVPGPDEPETNVSVPAPVTVPEVFNVKLEPECVSVLPLPIVNVPVSEMWTGPVIVKSFAVGESVPLTENPYNDFPALSIVLLAPVIAIVLVPAVNVAPEFSVIFPPTESVPPDVPRTVPPV
jgi:hypothetical protein